MGDSPDITLHVEVCLKSGTTLPSSDIKKQLESYFESQDEVVLNKAFSVPILTSDVKYVTVCSDQEKFRVNLSNKHVIKHFYFYETWEEQPQMDSFSTENEEVPASMNWCLPNAAFEGLWESLILENDLKERLMSYVRTTLLYSNIQVNSKIVLWNGVILLHGPPGTGKTSLCKALAQKLSIILNSKYKTSQLIEINSHSLFSKWFSESAKLVQKMFTSVRQWLESGDHFVCILIDEVESLTHVRKAKGNEPSDSIRVVNAVLTQIDQLQRYPNFLILSTSNVTDTIDLAFADRADLKLYLPYPSVWARYEILRTCIVELISKGLVKGNKNDIFEADIYERMVAELQYYDRQQVICEIEENSAMLYKVCTSLYEVSGRTLRKVPFLTSSRFGHPKTPTVKEFLQSMEEVILKLKAENNYFLGDPKKITLFL